MLQSFEKGNLEGPDMQTIRRRGTQIRVAVGVCLMLFAGSTLCGATSEVGPTGASPQSASVNPQLNRSLKILYAGRPDSDREKDFVVFLKKYFDVVQTGNLQTFKEGDTQGFDVMLLDWNPNAIEGPTPTVSPSFSRPVITLGIRGALICRQWRLRTGYL